MLRRTRPVVTEYDPLYVAARHVLLDALEALGPQRDAVIVVGAQAIYMRTGEADVAVAPYTTDADLVLTPAALADEPRLEALMNGADFYQATGQPGVWLKSTEVEGRPVDVQVDLMVPEALAPVKGKRSAHVPPHDKMAARRAIGLEGAAVDCDVMDVPALEPGDGRRFAVRVAGVAALLVAKLHKLHDRLAAGKEDRIADKDAADIFRLMQAVPADRMTPKLRELGDDAVSAAATRTALDYLPDLFGAARSIGVVMASRALQPAVPETTIAAICNGFASEVLDL